MITTQEQPVKERTEITEKQVIGKLIGYALQRKIAFEKHQPNFKTGQKIEACLEIIAALDKASEQTSVRECVKQILKTTLNLHYIAPNDKKEFIAWYEKIEDIMSSCREYLRLKSQF